jgi:hypothetical protein
MTDKPIIFSAPMVRALLDGRKTQTRRALKPQPSAEHCLSSSVVEGASAIFRNTHTGYRQDVRLPYAVGDRLWVPEAHYLHSAHGQHRADGQRWGPWGGLPMATSPDGTQVAYYREGFNRCHSSPWRSSIHMPRWASRITLLVIDVRAQRVQDISEEDAIAEGVEWINPPASFGPDVTSEEIYGIGCQTAFHDLWNEIHGPDAWDRNDWVAAYSFERLPA